MTEKQWQAQVLEMCTAARWRHFHVHDSRRSDPGWPDLVLIRPPQLIVAELKTDRGRVSIDQADWIAMLTACGLEVYVWRPRDFDAVWSRLTTNAPGQVTA